MARQEVIAVVFDFDDTLAPDTTTMLLREHGIDTDHFWKEDVRVLVDQGYDQAVAWLTDGGSDRLEISVFRRIACKRHHG